MKKLLFKTILLAAAMGVGTSASWADTTVGATNYTTGYLGAKSEAYAINSNGTWTFTFTNFNSGNGSTWNNWLLECSNGVCDEFVLRADTWEVVRGANANITSTYAGSDFVTDLNGAAVSMTVTRDGNHIAVEGTITPATEVSAYTYSYDFYTASGDLDLNLSVDHSYIIISSASWASSVGTITETEVVNCDFENDETLFTAPTTDNNNTTTISNVEKDGSNVLSIYVSEKAQNSKYSFSKYDFSSYTSDASFVKVAYDCFIPDFSSAYNEYITIGDKVNRPDITGTGYSSTGAIFNVGNIRSKNGGSQNYDWFGINSTCKDHDGTHLGVWLHVEAFVDLVNNRVTYKIQNQERTEIFYKDYEIAFLNASAAACTQIDVHKATNGRTTLYMDNLVITKYVDNSVIPTTYTIKYENSSGTTLKSSRVVDTYVGVDYTAISSDMATFYNGDSSKKYVYKSGNEEKTATATASENVITLIFDEYDRVAYTVIAKNGDDVLKTLASDNAYTDGSTTVYWNKYIEVAGQWYVTTNPYGKTITEAGNTDVTYSPSDICRFIECESTSYSSAGDQTSTGASGGRGVLLAKDKAMTTPSKITAGVYDISVYAYVRRANEDGLKLQYSTNNSDWNDVTTLIFASSVTSTQTAEKVILAEDSYIRFVDIKSQNSCHYYDYIILKESTVTGTIASSGYSSFASSYGLDFANATGLTNAFVVTNITKDAVMLSSVDELPANSGVILKGTGGAAYSIPVKADASFDGTNKLHAAVTAYDCAANEVYILQSGLFHLVTAASTVPAGKAYLLASDVPNEARSLMFAFDDETTGIDAVSSNWLNGDFYNLQGQRVDSPKKGLYIVNGRKVLVK